MENESTKATPETIAHAAVVVPTDEARNRERLAIVARKQWMRMMGLSEDEILERCDTAKYPAILEQELEELAAMQRIEEMNRK